MQKEYAIHVCICRHFYNDMLVCLEVVHKVQWVIKI